MAFTPEALTPDMLDFLTVRHLATLTTLRRDGSPHVVPVGFSYDASDRRVRMITGPASQKARNAARTKAREEGKKGAELQAAVDAAVSLTDDQKKALADAEGQMKQVQTEIREAVLALLTDEQKQAAGLNKPQKAKKGKKAKDAG